MGGGWLDVLRDLQMPASVVKLAARKVGESSGWRSHATKEDLVLSEYWRRVSLLNIYSR